MIHFKKFNKTNAVSVSILALAAFSGNAWSDYQINDDLIVDGSACVGFDCVNGESFGFDTIRVKENNLRIKFLDTSSSASFPRNDWQLTANDSSNGGAEKFSIDDVSNGKTPFTVEANAPSHSLYVDDGGRIGLGTSTPVVDIHTKSGNTPTLRLDQDGSSGFTPQAWDVAGNETNFFIRDATNGSTLPFRIRPNSPTSSIEINTNKVIVGTGDQFVGIGETAPEEKLHVTSPDYYQLRLENPAAGGGYWNIGQTDDLAGWVVGGEKLVFVPDSLSTGNAALILQNDGKVQVGGSATDATHDFQIVSGTSFSKVNAGETNFTVTSSRQLKENIHPVGAETILDRVAKVPVVTYDWKQQVWDGDEVSRTDKIGLIAEDFHNVFGRGSDKQINGSEVQMALWLSVQELNAEKLALEKRNAQLEQRIARIEQQFIQN